MEEWRRIEKRIRAADCRLQRASFAEESKSLLAESDEVDIKGFSLSFWSEDTKGWGSSASLGQGCLGLKTYCEVAVSESD